MWKVDNLQSFQSSFRLQLSQDLTSRTWKNGIKKGLRIKCGSWRGKLKVLQQSAQFWWTSSTASIQDLQELSTLLHHPKYPKSDQNVEMICPYDSKSTYIVYIYIYTIFIYMHKTVECHLQQCCFVCLDVCAISMLAKTTSNKNPGLEY